VEPSGQPSPPGPYPEDEVRPLARGTAGLWALGEQLTWISALVLTLSTLMDWYAGRESGAGSFTLSVIGWHTGTLGKLVFFCGLAVLILVAAREFGFELPPVIPEPLVVIGIGALATIFVLIRLIWIPDQFLPASGRGIGIYISLIAAIGVIFAGLLRAGEEI
jgi:hypothetical protein